MSMLSSITPVSSLSKLTWSTESSISLLPSSTNSASIYTNRDLYINLTRKQSNQSSSVNSKNTMNQSISNQSTSTATPSLTITTSSNSQNKLYTVVYHPNGYGSVYVWFLSKVLRIGSLSCFYQKFDSDRNSFAPLLYFYFYFILFYFILLIDTYHIEIKFNLKLTEYFFFHLFLSFDLNWKFHLEKRSRNFISLLEALNYFYSK